MQGGAQRIAGGIVQHGAAAVGQDEEVFHTLAEGGNARVVHAQPAGAQGMTGIIVPKKTVGEVQKLLDGVDGDVHVEVSDTKIRFTVGPVVLLSKLIEGTFPDYDRVTPKNNDKQMLVDSSAEDLIVSAGLTGTPASWLKPSLRARGIDPDTLPATPPPRSYDSSDVDKPGRWRDLWAAGQGVGAIKAVEPVATVVAQLRDEYEQAARRFAGRVQENDDAR